MTDRERDCNSSLKRPRRSFVEVSGFSVSGSHLYRGQQRHSGRREARFSEMPYCSKQRKSPSLDGFQAVCTQITNMKGVSVLSVGSFLTLSVTAGRSCWILIFFFSTGGGQCEKPDKCCPSKGQRKFNGCRIAQINSPVVFLFCVFLREATGVAQRVTICLPPC